MPTGKEIMIRATTLLNDEDHIRWPLSELCDWINEGTRAICLAKPSASSRTMVLQLAIGTLQTLPETGSPLPLSLISINRNIVQLGPPQIAGRMIKRADRALLDAMTPDWHNRNRTPFAKEVRNYTFDENLPRQYYVYPGNDGSGLVEAELGVLPDPIKIPDGADPLKIDSYDIPIGLPEPYSIPLLDYTLYRCQMKDDIDGAAGRSAAHYQQFAAAIGMKIQVEAASSPNQRRA